MYGAIRVGDVVGFVSIADDIFLREFCPGLKPSIQEKIQKCLPRVLLARFLLVRLRRACPSRIFNSFSGHVLASASPISTVTHK